MERGEAAIVAAQLVALIVVVLVLSGFTPGQSAQSTPVVQSVYWGTQGHGDALRKNAVTRVSENESVVTAYFSVAFSTQVSSVSGSRLCTTPGSTQAEATDFSPLPFTFDSNKGTGSIPLSPATQQAGAVCTYTIKVTDSLSQTVTWIGSVQFNP